MEIDKDKQLVREALEGSQAAFNALLTMYWQDIYTFLAAKRLCPEDTEDLCIETFSKAFEKLDTYDENYRFKTWLINIAKTIMWISSAATPLFFPCSPAKCCPRIWKRPIRMP